jgi:hypothetical protein
MKSATRIAAQGDVLFRRIDALPRDARKQPRDGPLVVAHSETGHHHVVRATDVELYRGGNPMLCYLRLEGAFADVEHLRPFDTHETLRLLGSDTSATYFEVRRQREHTPEGPRWIED